MKHSNFVQCYIQGDVIITQVKLCANIEAPWVGIC